LRHCQIAFYFSDKAAVKANQNRQWSSGRRGIADVMNNE